MRIAQLQRVFVVIACNFVATAPATASTFQRDSLADARRELDAWSAFVKKYTDSPWSALAQRRVLALQSPQPALPVVTAPAAPAPRDTSGGPLSQLAGDWGLQVFVMGAGQFGGPNCGKGHVPGGAPVTLAAPDNGAISISVSCDSGSEYAFRLRYDSTTQSFLLTVHSRPGISVEDFPVTYTEGRGWKGKRDQPVDSTTVSVTALVAPIEGRLWRGWMIAVLPTVGIEHEDDLKQAYFRVDLTRAK